VFRQPIEFLADSEMMNRTWSDEESLAYTKWLATHHYENFHVASLFLPRRLHQDFFNVYAYCRWSDDLGDETGSTEKSLELLAWWREELSSLYAGKPATHPVFIALGQTIEKCRLPADPFTDLLDAFVQDQRQTRYRDWDEVLGYCAKSANPVGRLVLMLGGYHDEERFRLSDSTCTALQLANFWQDVAVDLLKDRIYLPQHLFDKYGYTETQLYRLEYTPEFAAMMEEAVDYAQALFKQGLPLVRMLDRRLSLDIDLFSRGGMRVLDKIRRQDYDVLSRRPSISRAERVGLLIRSLARAAFAA
jgi:squalene synthase HpnC